MASIIQRWNKTIILLLPSTTRLVFENKGRYTGRQPDQWKGFVGIPVTIGIIGLILAFSYSFIIHTDNVYVLLALRLGGFFAPLLGYAIGYIILFFLADRRTKQVEQFLPDALQLIAANLRAGVTPYDAVKAASIDDFGVLGDAFKHVTDISAGNVSFADVLRHVTFTIESPALSRCMALFASSLKSGGHLAELLEGLALDITERRALKKELVTNTRTNTLFIVFTIVVGTPLLLAISIYFVDMVSNMQTSVGGGTTGFGLGGLGGEISITSQFLIQFSYIILLVTGLLASLFMGAMIEGDPKQGLRYAVLIIGGSYIMFFIARWAIIYFMGVPG